MMNQVERFRSALSAQGSAKDYHNVLVDWWDGTAGVWRPSMVDGRGEGFDSSFRSHVDILFPESFDLYGRGACETRSVRISDLRPSRLISDSIARFFTTRYALEILEDLEPCIDGGRDADRAQLETVARDLRRVYQETFSQWKDLFETGSAEAGAEGTLCHVSDDLDVLKALSRTDTPAGAALQTFRNELIAGEMSCSPVAWWDENGRTWRPTILVGATGAPSQFMPNSRVRIVLPDQPLAIRQVCGADLKPLDIAAAGFSLCAMPVLLRDILQLHRGLIACGFGDFDVQFDPMLCAIGEMLTGATREWGAQFALGLPGAAPEPRVVPLHPEMWGLSTTTTSNDVGAWWQSDSPSERSER